MTTPRGTPLAQSWTDDWIARVEQREDELDRRICGARTIGHAPCPAGSTHPSGRCVHHGGFALTGAPDGNRNAAVHFLYARRLMPCGNHCPAWKSCPLGGGAADHGKEIMTRAYPDRPTCPFEQAEYTAVVTDALKRTQFNHENAWGLHLAHQLALMTVLVSRAARAMATLPFYEEVDLYQGEHHTTTTKPSTALIAYEKLTRELRRWAILLERSYAWLTADQQSTQRHTARQSTDTFPDPDSLFDTMTGRQSFSPRDLPAPSAVKNGSPLDLHKKNSPLTSSPSIPSICGSNALHPNLRTSASSADNARDRIGENRCQSVGNALDLPQRSALDLSAPSASSAVKNGFALDLPPDPALDLIDVHHHLSVEKQDPFDLDPSALSASSAVRNGFAPDPNLRPSASSADKAIDLDLPNPSNPPNPWQSNSPLEDHPKFSHEFMRALFRNPFALDPSDPSMFNDLDPSNPPDP